MNLLYIIEIDRIDETPMTTKKPKQRSPKGIDRADSLMAAAIDLFSEREYSQVTIQDITRRAGVTHSLVYYHFKNKEELFTSAVTDLINSTIKSYQESRKDHSDPADLIEDWFENNIKLADDLRKLVKIMFDFSGKRKSSSPSVAKAIRKFYRQEHQILATSIAKGVATGTFKQVDAERLAAFVSTHIDGIFYNSFVQPKSSIETSMDDLRWFLRTQLGYKDSGKRSK